jgi:hypothetical protein
MKILPVASLALAAALATSVLAVAPSYALQYPNQAQNCASGSTSSEGVGECKNNRGVRGFATTEARQNHRSDPEGLGLRGGSNERSSTEHASAGGRSGGGPR